MQGYIININRVKDEDLIVTILTESSIHTAYRFYGARHSTINLGYKIDFELQGSIKSSIPQLRSVLHLGSKWTMQRDRMYIWQSFIQLFYRHLKDIDDISSFYFELLENCNEKWEVQNPKRISIESYIKLLEYEGRLHDEFICFNCEEAIHTNPSLIRGFLLAHEECVWSDSFDRSHVEDLFHNKSTLYFDDKHVDKLWKIVMEGF
jgi:recombinational DNA repair protein (RecF pathway)